MEDEEQIIFEKMPNMFGRMLPKQGTTIDGGYTTPQKTYSSLFEELCDKCNPERFMEPYNATLVEAATKMYSDILHSKDDAEVQKELMHKAYTELGVKFDGSKLYHYLMEYLDPKQYMEPFNSDRVLFANRYYPSIEANKGDYIALEGILSETQGFINQIEEERALKRKEEEERIALTTPNGKEQPAGRDGGGNGDDTSETILVLLGLFLFSVVLVILIATH